MTKIMVVEDEPELREMIRGIVTYEGFDVLTAEDGEDFLNKIEQYQPDFVTLDVMMPGLSTWEILEKLKEKKANPHVMLLTAVQLSMEEKQRLKDSGMVIGVIRKPFDVDELVAVIKKVTDQG